MSNTNRFQGLSLFLGLIFLLTSAEVTQAAEQTSSRISLQQAIQILNKQNPQIKAAESVAQKESALIKSQYALPDPMVSYQELERGNNTKYWGVSQKIEFPTSYIYKGAAQKHRSKAARIVASLTALELRGEVISTYYEAYSLQKMIEFTEANRSAIREVARVAERKYASGDVSQADSMRAHVEQTSLEAEIRLLQQRRTIALSRLKELLSIPQQESIELSSESLQVPPLPGFEVSTDQSLDVELAHENVLVAKNKNAEAISEFMPDFQVRYQRQFSGLPDDSHILMLEASVPLWFWGATGKKQAAAYEQSKKQSDLIAAKNRLDRQHYSLRENLKTQKELLDIYQNALIPQAQTSYNATSSSYRASKASFLDLLERERFLLGVQIKSFSALIEYVKLLTQYEQVIGKEIIDLSRLQENL